MTGASEELLQAVYGLRKAAEAEFKGNTYYQVANQINGLIEQFGWGGRSVSAGKGAAYGFASMLADVRKIVETSTSGNRYYMMAHELNLLASFLAPSVTGTPESGAISEKRAAALAANAPASAPAGVPASASGSAPAPASIAVSTPASAPIYFTAARPTFNDLAAVSKARVEEAAASLGIVSAHASQASHHEAAPILADGELERRSSEPCAMAELAPVIMEPVAAAAIPAEALAAPQLDGAAHHLGSPTAEARDGAIEGSATAAAPEAAAQPAGVPPAPAHESMAPAARQKVESFDELAAASKAQVERAAASLGMAAAHPMPPSHAEAGEAPAERRLESRSFEAVTQALETMESAAIPGEIAAEPSAAEAAFHLGSPAAEGEAFAVQKAVLVEIAAAEITLEPVATHASTPMHEAPAMPAGQKIEAKEPEQPKRKEPKTLFRLWLDLAFGRKD